MLKKVLISTAMVLHSAMLCFAQPSAPTAPTENPHKTYDQKVRECRKLAIDQQLTGEVSRAFIAQCVKGAP
jgi:hypothetical protein